MTVKVVRIWVALLRGLHEFVGARCMDVNWTICCCFNLSGSSIRTIPWT